MTLFLHGLALKNYRGIGDVDQFAAPFRSCNFFIGANNSGKSTFLNFISLHLNDLFSSRNTPLKFKPWEAHLGKTEHEIGVAIGFPLRTVLEACKASYAAEVQNPSAFGMLEQVIHALAEADFIWFEISPFNVEERKFRKENGIKSRSGLSENNWSFLWQVLVKRTQGDIDMHWIPQVLNWIRSHIDFYMPSAYIIPAMRRIGSKDQSFDDYSGKGLIDRLAELQNPGPDKRDLFFKFTQINEFLKDITGDQNIRIEVPHHREELLVHKDGRVLPLSSLGTGIHEVVMIAAFCTMIGDSIVCIEEPEVHLHPLLQKKLISYLIRRTSNQYFVATHSASIIDQPDAAVFHVTQKNSITHIELASLPSQKFRVCRDLGYRASDLLQTNFIIWVEGPTDRLYLNHWIRSVDGDLHEGLHYSIMFYGGRLLSHLSADDIEIDEFISLRKLNQNVAILIDSDKSSAQSHINATKRRILDEFEKHSEIAWITAGREIENYLPSSLLESVLGRLYPNFEKVVSSERYEHRLDFLESGSRQGTVKSADKVKVAHGVCGLPAALDVLDLRKRVEELVSKIRDAND